MTNKAMIETLLVSSTLLLGQERDSVIHIDEQVDVHSDRHIRVLDHRQKNDITKEDFRFDVTGAEEIDVNIEYGMGELTIAAAGEPGTAEGFVRYNAALMTPDVSYRTHGNRGDLHLGLESAYDEWTDEEGLHFNIGFDWEKFRESEYDSEMSFNLPTDVPLEIDMEFGLGEANLNLSELAIEHLEIDCGLSDTRIEMETRNPAVCRRVYIEAGIGDLNGDGMGNLRIEDLHLTVGLGAADLDLRGEITEDMEAEIEVGLGSLELILPEDVNIHLTVEHSFLSSVDVSGLVEERDEWLSRDWMQGRPTLEIDISVGLGSVDVRVR